MRDSVRDVLQFQLAAGESLATHPTVPPDEQRLLKARLITEEYVETMEAMGYRVHAVTKLDSAGQPYNTIELADAFVPDPIATADGLCDLSYVTVGANNVWGLPLVECWDEVHRTNMAKFADGARFREDGKILKPPGWKAPDIRKIVQASIDRHEAHVKIAAKTYGNCDGCGTPLLDGVCHTEGCKFSPILSEVK